jgi:hypothetical protein
MIQFSDDHPWDDLLPRLREALARGAFTDLAEAQRAFDLAPDEPFEGTLDDELVEDAAGSFTASPWNAPPVATPGVAFSSGSTFGLSRSRSLRTELLERRDALSAMPMAQLASCSPATAVGWQVTATVWHASLAGRAPAAFVSAQAGGFGGDDYCLGQSALRSSSRLRPTARRAAPDVHDHALAELLAAAW